jgi:hypothetical protein
MTLADLNGMYNDTIVAWDWTGVDKSGAKIQREQHAPAHCPGRRRQEPGQTAGSDNRIVNNGGWPAGHPFIIFPQRFNSQALWRSMARLRVQR